MARVPFEDTAEPIDPCPGPETVAQQRLLAEAVREVLGTMCPEKRRLLELCFGLGGNYSYTAQEIARILRRSDHHVH